MAYSAEHMGTASDLRARQGIERSGVQLDTLEVQTVLALESFKKIHPDAVIDSIHWAQNDTALLDAAMNEWVADPADTTSHAAQYRMYIQEHPEREVDIENPLEVAKLLVEIEGHKVVH